ncbi:hypothetical protein JOF56_011635 [Kibdelosporangium banguiense]|uniref:Uncharacterized protein n=1 Tax=Kibdelosporangium banguiense TaxID=1365924 RepID=A0ABS4U4W5_9PSEU|nr:hypothetical protein [Kibdelosporangium banguiense]
MIRTYFGKIAGRVARRILLGRRTRLLRNAFRRWFR